MSPIILPAYAFASLPVSAHEGELVWTSNGCDGSPGILVWTGGHWLQIPIGTNGTAGAGASDS